MSVVVKCAVMKAVGGDDEGGRGTGTVTHALQATPNTTYTHMHTYTYPPASCSSNGPNLVPGGLAAMTSFTWAIILSAFSLSTPS